MEEQIILGWSPQAVGQILELPSTARDRVENCVDLLSRFPRMGNRVRIPGEHIRRFLCGDYWIVYRLEETGAGEPIEFEPRGSEKSFSTRMTITIKYIRPDTDFRS